MFTKIRTYIVRSPTSTQKFYNETDSVLRSLSIARDEEEAGATAAVNDCDHDTANAALFSYEFPATGDKFYADSNAIQQLQLRLLQQRERLNDTNNDNNDNNRTMQSLVVKPLQGTVKYKQCGTTYEFYTNNNNTYGKLTLFSTTTNDANNSNNKTVEATYVGNFNDRGEFSGFGTYNSRTNGTQHEGLYKNGKPNGPGMFRFKNLDTYNGQFVDGLLHGWGTLVFHETGDRYDGEFARGAMSENGVYTWKNGNCYVGKWKNNKMHGPGAFSDGEEVFILCEYKNGKKIREEKKGELPEALKQHRKRMQESMKMSNPQSMKLQSSSSMKISKMYKEFGEANLFKRMFSSRSQSVRRVKAGGQTIYKGHRSYELMTQLQLGIIWSISNKQTSSSTKTKTTTTTTMTNLQQQKEQNDSEDITTSTTTIAAGDESNNNNKKLTVQDFDSYVKVRFPRIGSEITPPHASSDFKWKLYSPKVFKNLRSDWGVDESEFMLSICGEQALKEMNSAGKSGSVFFISSDDRYIIKTMRKLGMKALLKMLPKYYRHMQENEDSLLTKFFGVFSVKPKAGRKVRFIVMRNLFCDSLEIHDTYDLKGSTLGRFTSHEKRLKARLLGSTVESGVILKDLDLGFKFRLEKSKRDLFIRQVSLDLKLLEELHIMDYSLLVGVHYTNENDRKSKSESMISLGSEQLNDISEEDIVSGNGTPRNMSLNEEKEEEELATTMTAKKPKKGRKNSKVSFDDNDENGEYAWALNIYQELSKNFGSFETVAATSTKPLVFKYINHGGKRNEEKRPLKGADEQIAQVVGHQLISSNSLPKQLACVCVPGIAFKSLAKKDIKVIQEEPRVRDAVLHLGIIDILQIYSASKKLERGWKGAVYKATGLSVATPKFYARRFKDFMRNIFE